MRKLAENHPARSKEIALATLSSREWEVLLLLTEGKSNAEIAERIFITVKSLHNNKNRISRKLSIKGYRSLNTYAANNKIALKYWYKVLENKTHNEKLKAVFYRLGLTVT